MNDPDRFSIFKHRLAFFCGKTAVNSDIYISGFREQFAQENNNSLPAAELCDITDEKCDFHKQTSLYNIYNYFRYVFDLSEGGMSLSELLESGELLAVYLDVYYNEDVNYDEYAYGTLFLYDYKTDIIEQRLSVRDKRAIREYIGG